MTLLLFVLCLIALAALAYANGANDISKSVATLVGSGVSDYRRALRLGVLATVAGGLLSIVLAHQMLVTFTRGLLVSDFHPGLVFAHAVVMASLAWVFLATWLRLPVSTTHAIVGAIIGAGWFSFGLQAVRWSVLTTKIVAPLLLSPILGVALALAIYLAVCRLRAPTYLGVLLHWCASAGTSLARALNDTPKIVALSAGLFLYQGHVPGWVYGLTTLAMGLGAYVAGQRVTTVLAEKVTSMDHTEGLAANLATASLVGVAANFGLPVSTTHVSSGAIIGVGARNGLQQVRWQVVRDMALAWFVTVPICGIMAVAVYCAFNLCGAAG